MNKTKNIVFIARSLDGYIADKDGELDWLTSIPNPKQIDMGYGSLMEEVDAIVMGRTTFETVCGFEGQWPYTKHVFVLSKSMKKVPDKYENKVSLLQGKPLEILEIIHKKGFFTLYLDGGTTIQNFLKEDFIDELRITTFPILLGGGVPLFGDLFKPLNFKLLKSEVFLGQLVQDHYVRNRD